MLVLGEGQGLDGDGGELDAVSAVHARGRLPRRALGSGVLLELRASGEVENRRGSSSGWRCPSPLVCSRKRALGLPLHTSWSRCKPLHLHRHPAVCYTTRSGVYPGCRRLTVTVFATQHPPASPADVAGQHSNTSLSRAAAKPVPPHTCVANPIPTSTHATKDTTHPPNPPQWSPRHDWDPVSHNTKHSANALPLAPPDAPALPAACAFASTTPCHTSPTPRPRARLICRRPHRPSNTHWQRARRARCTSAAPRTAPPAVSWRKAWGKRRLVRCTNHYRLWRCTHPAAVFLPAPAEGEACVALLLRAAARRCATARVTLHRRQGSGHAP